MTATFSMNKPSIKDAAIFFRQSLIDWKDKNKTLEIFKRTRDSWTDEQLVKAAEYCEKQIAPILEASDPILKLAIDEAIDEPFDFSGYITSKVGRVLSDELSYPEITEPYYKFVETLRGGLSHQEFYKTEFYKLRLLPKGLRETLP